MTRSKTDSAAEMLLTPVSGGSPGKKELSKSSLNTVIHETSEETKRVRPDLRVFTDLSVAARVLAADVAVELGSEVEELSTGHSSFRTGLQSAFARILHMAQQKPEKVIVFGEAIPGFTLMLFKREIEEDERESEQVGQEGNDSLPMEPSSAENAACSLVAAQYFQRTGHKVLSVTSQDAIFAFFPVEDLRQNLKEMGFYLLE